jgi:hypothetical protein
MKPVKSIQSIGSNISNVQGSVFFEKINQIGSQTIIQGESTFEEIEFGEFKKSLPLEEQEISQLKSNKLVKDLCIEISKHHILFIAKDRKVRKANLARTVAYFSEGNKSFVRESTQSQNLGLSLQRAIRKVNEPSIFVLLDAKFNTFGLSYDDFDELEKLARKNNHYILITTDEAKADWDLDQRFLFYESVYEQVQDCPFLVNTLSDEKLFEKWYLSLDKKHQIIAIALSFFDGVYGDQLFSATEKIIKKSWAARIPEMEGFDYCDLKPLQDIFSLYNKSKEKESSEIISARERYLVLSNAWKLHRRQIIYALPTLKEIAKESITASNYELYGSEERKNQIRLAVSEAISNIGLLSQDSKVTEEILLALASDQNIQVQAIAASALANWRSSDKQKWLMQDAEATDEKMIEVLNRWQEEAQMKSFLSSFITETDYKESSKPFDFVRATIALSLGYASELDVPEKMSEKLVKLFVKLVNDENVVVQNRVLSDTLPRVLRRHTKQISHEVKSLLKSARLELIIATSKSLAETYQYKQDIVLQILKSWYKEAQSNRSEKVFKDKLTFPEILLLTVFTTYGELDFSASQTKQDVVSISETLKESLREERHPLIRTSAISALGRQAQKSFLEVEPYLQELTKQISKTERNNLAKILGEIYLNQRHDLKGGDSMIEVEDVEYDVWLYSKRPTTDIEKAISRWLRDDYNAMGQQVAVYASTIFADKLDREESRQIEELKRETNSKQEKVSEGTYALPIQPGLPPQDWYLGRLIPSLATRGLEKYRTSVRNILPEGIKQSESNPESISFVLRKWSISPDLQLKNLSSRLNLAILLAKYVKFIIAGSLLICSSWVFLEVKKIQNNTPSGKEDVERLDSPPPTPSQSEPTITPLPLVNPFESVRYPQSVCGDSIEMVERYPVEFFPVYSRQLDSINIIKKYCRDALQMTREKNGREFLSVQIASFISQERAQLFKEFIEAREPYIRLEIGEPTVVQRP